MIDAAARNELESGLETLGLDRALAEPLLAYLALLLRWNAAYNLTAIRDPREMVSKHLLDSLAMHEATAPLAAAGGSLADLGTGAGFPGIPLAIAQPGLQVALVESNGKKARFLREAVRSLGLANAKAVESRIEAYDAVQAHARKLTEQLHEALKTIPGAKLNSPANLDETTGIANVSLKNVDGVTFSNTLRDRWKMIVRPALWGTSIRISLACFTREEDLDNLLENIATLAKG